MIIDRNLNELSRLLESREASSVDVTRAFLERIGALNPEINAFITVDEKRALSEASDADRRRADGAALSPFDGIPVAVKDNICTRGLKTTCASKILSGFVPPYDATAYEKLRTAGFVTLGKTNLDEFAMGSTTETSFFGPVKNPWAKDRVPGGSSGGSAAAVAASMTPAALGSDTGGSIRQPAAFCGVVGIKPTYGRVSRYGLVAYASSLDQIGTFGFTVDDAASLLAVISGHDRRDSTSVDRPVDFSPDSLAGGVKGLVVGVPQEYFNGVSDGVVKKIRERLAALESAGAKCVDISLRYTEYAIPVYYLIATAEASSNLARFDGVRYGHRSEDASNLAELYLKSRSEGFGNEVKRRIILGTFALSSGYYDAFYLRALKGRRLIMDDFRAAFSRVDAIVAPVAPNTAFPAGSMLADPLQMYVSDVLSVSANLAGIPAVSLPAGLDGNGLPVGLQIMGDHFSERKILTVARAIEIATQKPAL